MPSIKIVPTIINALRTITQPSAKIMSRIYSDEQLVLNNSAKIEEVGNILYTKDLYYCTAWKISAIDIYGRKTYAFGHSEMLDNQERAKSDIFSIFEKCKFNPGKVDLDLARRIFPNGYKTLQGNAALNYDLCFSTIKKACLENNLVVENPKTTIIGDNIVYTDGREIKSFSRLQAVSLLTQQSYSLQK